MNIKYYRVKGSDWNLDVDDKEGDFVTRIDWNLREKQHKEEVARLREEIRILKESKSKQIT